MRSYGAERCRTRRAACRRRYAAAVADQTLPIEPGRRRLDALAATAGDAVIAQLRTAAEPLAGLCVLHVTAPPFGSAVVDHLTSVVPLLRELGIDARWRAIAGDPAAHAAGRALQDGVRGGELALTEAQVDAWRGQRVAPNGADVVVLHDAGALGAAAQRAKGDGARWAWRLHGDGSSPQADAWAACAPLADALDARAVAHLSLAPPGLREPAAIAPAVDPLAARHLALPPKLAGDFARGAGIDLSRPAIVAVADLDAWAEPEDAVDTWLAARATDPAAARSQLVLVARVAHGDERAWRALGELHEYARPPVREDIVVCADVAGHGDGAANAAQRLARVALQDGRDGYGIAAAEALYKGTPVVAADTAPLRAQLGGEATGGETPAGRIAATPAERGAQLAALIADPGLAAELGRAGHEHVVQTHLVTRLLAEEIAWLRGIAAR